MIKLVLLVVPLAITTLIMAHPTIPSHSCWTRYVEVKSECTNASLARWHLTDNQDNTNENNTLAYCCAFLEFKGCVRHKIEAFCSSADRRHVDSDLESMIVNAEGCADVTEGQKAEVRCGRADSTGDEPEVSKRRLYPEEVPIEDIPDDGDDTHYYPYGRDGNSALQASTLLITGLIVVGLLEK